MDFLLRKDVLGFKKLEAHIKDSLEKITQSDIRLIEDLKCARDEETFELFGPSSQTYEDLEPQSLRNEKIKRLYNRADLTLSWTSQGNKWKKYRFLTSLDLILARDLEFANIAKELKSQLGKELSFQKTNCGSQMLVQDAKGNELLIPLRVNIHSGRPSYEGEIVKDNPSYSSNSKRTFEREQVQSNNWRKFLGQSSYEQLTEIPYIEITGRIIHNPNNPGFDSEIQQCFKNQKYQIIPIESQKELESRMTKNFRIISQRDVQDNSQVDNSFQEIMRNLESNATKEAIFSHFLSQQDYKQQQLFLSKVYKTINI